MVVCIVDVFGEVGGEDDYLIIGLRYGFQCSIDGSGGAAGHHYLIGGEGQASCRRQMRCYGSARLRVACVGHISMHTRPGFVRPVAQLFAKLLRRLDYGVAQR